MDFYILTGASPLALAKFIFYTDLQLVKITQTNAIANTVNSCYSRHPQDRSFKTIIVRVCNSGVGEKSVVNIQ